MMHIRAAIPKRSEWHSGKRDHFHGTDEELYITRRKLFICICREFRIRKSREVERRQILKTSHDRHSHTGVKIISVSH